MAIARLMCEARLLRDENAQLLAQLEQAGAPGPAGAKVDRLEATLPAGQSGACSGRRASAQRDFASLPLFAQRSTGSECIVAPAFRPERASRVSWPVENRAGSAR